MNVFDLAQQNTQLKKVSHKEYAGPCPGCGGTDRFHVQPGRKDGGAWMCRNCWPAEEKGWADGIEYLRQFRNMSFSEAKAYLSNEVETTLAHVKRIQKYASLDYGQIPNQQWQQRAVRYVTTAQERLWTPDGQAALDYLRSRGLTDETIRKAHLGYAAYHGVPCVVIPWFDEKEQAYWRINLRDIRPDSERTEGEKRYHNITGSSNAGLYLGDSLKFKRPTFLVEGEIDALSIAQEAGNLVNVVATGTVTGSYTSKWIGRLARVPHVLVAYDRDSDGEKYAKERWLHVLENATRWRPLEHDVNAMLVEGYDVRSWVEAALDYISPVEPVNRELVQLVPSTTSVPPALSTQEPVEQVQAASNFCCSVCHVDLNDIDQDAYVDEDGVGYCSAHWQARNVTPARFTSQEQFTEHAASLAGPGWTVTPLTAGTPRKEALEQHVAKLPRKYIPATLPQLPRKRCPFEVVRAVGKSRDERIKVVACTGETLENGWCQAHQEANTLLELGAALGYPRVDQLGRYTDDYSKQTKYARCIGQGVACWEGYAQRALDSWLKADLPTLRRMATQQEQQSA